MVVFRSAVIATCVVESFDKTCHHLARSLMLLGELVVWITVLYLDLMLGKSKRYSPKWWFHGYLPWYKVKNHLKQSQVLENSIPNHRNIPQVTPTYKYIPRISFNRWLRVWGMLEGYVGVFFSIYPPTITNIFEYPTKGKKETIIFRPLPWEGAC